MHHFFEAEVRTWFSVTDEDYPSALHLQKNANLPPVVGQVFLRPGLCRQLFFFQLKRKRGYLVPLKNMGCLKLTYYPEPTLFLEEQAERTEAFTWRVWSRKERGFLGVDVEEQTQNGPDPWEIIKNSTGLLLRMGLRLPDAFSMAGNVDGVTGVGVDASPQGMLYIMNGVDRGKKFNIGDGGLALGLDVGASAVLTEYYYVNLFGTKRDMKAGDFEGLRFSVSAGASAIIEVGGGLSLAPVDPSNGIYIIGRTYHVGVSPPGISGNANFGWSWFWK